MGVSTLAGGPIISGIDALTPVTMLVWLSDEFRAVTDSDLGVSLDLLDRTIDAIQHVNRLMQLRIFTTATSRLAGVLLEYEAFCIGDAPLVARWQLSALAGVTPRMVSKILRKWEAAAILRRLGRSGLELLDRRALEAEAPPIADFRAPRSAGSSSQTGGLRRRLPRLERPARGDQRLDACPMAHKRETQSLRTGFR